jgi:WD40 repeat protein
LRFKFDYVGAIAYAPDGKTLALGSEGACYLMDMATGRIKATCERDGFVESAVFTPDGSGILLADCQRRLYLHESATGKFFNSFILGNDADSVNAPAAFSPDGKRLITGGRRGIHLMDVLSGAEVYKRDHEGVVAVDYSPDGRLVASGSWKSSIRLWAPARGDLVHEFEGHPGGVGSICFSHDGTMLVSGGADRMGRLWDLQAKQEVRRFAGHRGPVRVVALSPDGKTLASGSEDQTIRLWEVTTGRELLTIEREGAQQIVFSPDGTRLAAGMGSSVAIWDVEALLKGRK